MRKGEDFKLYVLSKVRCLTPLTFQELWQDIESEWGDVNERRLHRVLRKLRDEGRIEEINRANENDPGKGYILTKSERHKIIKATQESLICRSLYGANGNKSIGSRYLRMVRT